MSFHVETRCDDGSEERVASFSQFEAAVRLAMKLADQRLTPSSDVDIVRLYEEERLVFDMRVVKD